MTEHALGRRVEHDPRSRLFAFTAPPAPTAPTKRWRHYGDILDQGNIGACHDAETEILTRRGWLPFPDLTMDNEVATVDPLTSDLTFEKSTRSVKLWHEGPIYRVSNARHDFAVTPDHTMLVRKWNERERRLACEYSFVPMSDIGWYVGLMPTVVYGGYPEASETYTIPGIPRHQRASQRIDLTIATRTWLHFLGIYLAEGTMLKPTAKSPYKIQIAAVKEREKVFIREVLAALGVHALELRDRFTFNHARIYRHMEDLGLKGVYAAEKFIPEFVFDLPGYLGQALLAGHREGDGSYQDGRWTHHTSSPRLADDLQRLVFLTGSGVGVSIREPRDSVQRDGRVIRTHRPSYGVRSFVSARSCIERKKDVRIEPYVGWVYCAEVPTHHTLVTRRNGKILISGNCTGFAMAQWLNCKPAHLPREQYADNEDGLMLYAMATARDPWPGTFTYPPPGGQDTGSSGLAVCKAAQELGYIHTYRWIFQGVDQLKQALQTSPVLAGTNWYRGMSKATRAAPFVQLTGPLDGGHEYVILGWNNRSRYFPFLNSWGDDYGINGVGRIWEHDMARLLAEKGDLVVPEIA